jgi:hypothetical protein
MPKLPSAKATRPAGMRRGGRSGFIAFPRAVIVHVSVNRTEAYTLTIIRPL